MKNYNKEEALKVVIKVAKQYEEKLNNKHFLIIYKKNNQILNCEVGFRDMNFLHLTGLHINKQKMSAKKFYEACLSERVSLKDIELKKGGTVQQKLNVLPYLSSLLYGNCMIGESFKNGIKIKTDYYVGNTKAIISVGFRTGETVDIPVTLYSENIKKLTEPTCKVLAIFVKSYNSLIYNECTHIGKDIDISKFPKQIKCLLNKDLYMSKNQ